MPGKIQLNASRVSWRERATQAALGVFLWWAVYAHVTSTNGQGGGIIAATCAAWGYVLVGTFAVNLVNQRRAALEPPNRPRRPGGGRPGSSS